MLLHDGRVREQSVLCLAKSLGSCGRNAWFGEYVSVEWTEAEKMSRHLVLWSRNHEYIALMWKGRSYYQSMGLEFRYGDGKVLGTQPYQTHESTSNHCVLHLSLIKGIFNIVFYNTHTHTNMHLTINMVSNVP